MPVPNGGMKPYTAYLDKYETLDKFLLFLAQELRYGRVFKSVEAEKIADELSRAADLIYRSLKSKRNNSPMREFKPANGQPISAWVKFVYHLNGHVVYGVREDGEKIRLYSWDLDVLTRQVRAGILKEVYNG